MLRTAVNMTDAVYILHLGLRTMCNCCGTLMTMRWKWILGVIGMFAGGFVGVLAIVQAYRQAPGMPGIPELIVQLAIVVFLSSALGGLGFGLGCIIDLFGSRNRE